MIKVRLKFKRTEDLKFLSHLDQHRLFDRALRRADLPIAFTQGFNPHAIISFANAMSVGMTSDCEYVDIALDLDVDVNTSAASIMKRLNAVLPNGIRILESTLIPKDSKSLTRLVSHADYVITCLGLHVNDFDTFQHKLNKFAAKDKIMITKRNKKGVKVKRDIKESFDELTVEKLGKDVVFHIRILPVSGSMLSPETVIETFLKSVDYYNNSVDMIVHRNGLFLEDE